MKDELLSQMGGVRQYAEGGIVAKTNPGYARMLGLKYPKFNTKLREEDIIAAHGGLAPLMSLQSPASAAAPPAVETLIPTAPIAPEELRQLGGGIGSLLRRA